MSSFPKNSVSSWLSKLMMVGNVTDCRRTCASITTQQLYLEGSFTNIEAAALSKERLKSTFSPVEWDKGI
eukprot:scaffold808_cov194-Pinguiococcus_pyrenoidosus.AAC.2